MRFIRLALFGLGMATIIWCDGLVWVENAGGKDRMNEIDAIPSFVDKSGIHSLPEDPKTYFKGRKYVGEWKDGKHHGQGTIIYSDGARYVGEWKNNKYDGQGTITYADGEKWEGEFKDGELYTGHGTYFLKGYTYIGELKDGKPTLSQSKPGK